MSHFRTTRTERHRHLVTLAIEELLQNKTGAYGHTKNLVPTPSFDPARQQNSIFPLKFCCYLGQNEFDVPSPHAFLTHRVKKYAHVLFCNDS